MPGLRHEFTRGLLRSVAIAVTVVYAGWNVVWVVEGQIPPSLFLAVSGLPCPTTGGVRALRALAAGDVSGSLEYNAMALPLTFLFLVSLVWIGSLAVRRLELRLPPWVGVAWLVTLAAAWLQKLLF